MKMEAIKRPNLPRIGLFACFSGGSNTGSLTGLAALEVIRRLGNEEAGICSLPALLNQVPRQSDLVRKIAKIVVIDGCHQSCAKQLLANAGIKPQAYLNLETDLGLMKKGPFSSLDFNDEQIKQVAEAILAIINDLNKG
ncbi:MAG TPA: hypothetical protein ENO29_07020 [Candidatus Aminicenantes bacterium]|nr:MAG: hypothetical protein C0168_02435 [Candidatus Aminicenantes bacterium]HEK86088.1 hypothetical protein [Candidatus Aminicenantes bacterium]